LSSLPIAIDQRKAVLIKYRQVFGGPGGSIRWAFIDF
jgi:hypothetical protein